MQVFSSFRYLSPFCEQVPVRYQHLLNLTCPKSYQEVGEMNLKSGHVQQSQLCLLSPPVLLQPLHHGDVDEGAFFLVLLIANNLVCFLLFTLFIFCFLCISVSLLPNLLSHEKSWLQSTLKSCKNISLCFASSSPGLLRKRNIQ